MPLYYFLAYYQFTQIPWMCPNPEEHCVPMTLSNIWARSALVWVVVIHYVANDAMKQRQRWFLSLLYYRVFEDLSYFSLQLYLCHISLIRVLEFLRDYAHINWMNSIIHFVLIYYFSYLIRQHIHPILTKVAERVWPQPQETLNDSQCGV
jgi:hypothetical protein